LANPQAPPELQNAINSSSQKYGVPVDILTGVWARESGSSFPNNFVNSSGYGGLFGTTNWNGSTQSQSDYSASILAHLYSTYGNWASAIYHYSGGAYSSVAGQTTPGGSVIGGSSTSSNSSTSTTSSNTPSTNPLDIGGAISNLPATLINDFKPIGIGLGFGILAILLIIGGVFVIIAPAARGVIDTVKPV
jgi:hypothetical protein